MTWDKLTELIRKTSESSVVLEDFVMFFPKLLEMKGAPQDPIHHAEGDVWIHTHMVCSELLSHEDFQSVEMDSKIEVFLSALLHDLGKPQTMVKEDERVKHPGHSRLGSTMAREYLWGLGCPMDMRERICRMIAAHQVPFHVMNGEDGERKIRRLSWECDISLLTLLAKADLLGRHGGDLSGTFANIELMELFAHEDGCLKIQKSFIDDRAKTLYFRGEDVHPDYGKPWSGGSSVVMMSGLPASGKDSWLMKNHPDLPVVSFDDAREELGLKHGQNEGMAAHLAIEKAKGLLREKKPFAWNATHLNQRSRDKTMRLLLSYGAEVQMVHLEAPLPVLLKRNSTRDTSLKNKTILDMVGRWEPPAAWEAHSVRMESVESLQNKNKGPV